MARSATASHPDSPISQWLIPGSSMYAAPARAAQLRTVGGECTTSRPPTIISVGQGAAPTLVVMNGSSHQFRTSRTARALSGRKRSSTASRSALRLIGGSSWVSVRNSTRTLFEGVLRAGAVKDFRDPKQLRLIVGNAGAVNLVCSGRDLGPAGGQGAVRRFTCNAAGIVAG